MRRISIGIGLLTALLVQAAVSAQGSPGQGRERTDAKSRFCEQTLHGEVFARTELYFGLSRADGPNVTEEEFQLFLDTVVTPRFPDGLTLLSGSGQFRGASGLVQKEPSKVLILFYVWDPARQKAIERIRAVYKATFHQEAVLRVDDASCVSF